MGHEINYPEMEAILDSHEYWYVLSHVKPDGDTLGGASAIYTAGINRGKRVSWGGEGSIPLSYKFLPHTENYIKSSWIDLDSFKGKEPLFICIDISTLDRAVGGRHDQWKIINIDHHADNMRYGTYHHIEHEASSTCEIIWSFMRSQNWNVTKEIAIGLYTGLITDTGNFSFSNTRKYTHYIAADLLENDIDPNFINLAVRGNRTIEGMHLWGIAMSKMQLAGKKKQIGFTYLTIDDFRSTGADRSETEFLVNHILFIHGVEVAALIVEEPMQVRVGLRSIKGSVSAGKIARKLGGGGHELAAGSVCRKSINEVIRMVLNTIEDEYAERDTAGE
ncbi:MAG: DHH family phosphoesterase [Synergistaceae bacterium]|nr:DHH family phosphoesterase [Synergistaceae bacterium]